MCASLLARRRALVAFQDLTSRPIVAAQPSSLVLSPPKMTRPELSSCSSSWRLQSQVRAISNSFRRTSSANTASQVPSSSSTSNERATTTHYSFFSKTLPRGPPPKGEFAIDTRALRREFLSLQAQAHPDLALKENKSVAQALSARINEAYKVLSSPLLRAQYLLELRGQQQGEEYIREGRENDGQMDANFELLSEVMEIHHAVDTVKSEEELEPIRRQNNDRIRTSEETLGWCFAKDDLPRAVEEAIKLKYWTAIQERIHEWEEGRSGS